MVFDIGDFEWMHASTLTEEAEKRQVLEWFVNRVRESKTVNKEVMEFIAGGIEQHLKGKKPWGAKQGKKKRSMEQALRDALPIYAEFNRLRTKCLESKKPLDIGYVTVNTADKFGISEDTVNRALAIVKENRWSYTGKPIYDYWVLEQSFKRWISSPEGKAFLETDEGREMYKDSDVVHGKPE